MFFTDIQTERVYLKNIGYDDTDFMYKEFSTDEVNAFLFDAEPISSVEEAKELINFYVQPEPRGQHRWIMVLKDSNEKIGTCGFHCWDKEVGIVEIGYDIQPAYWRKGYASETLTAILKFAKESMKVKTVVAHIAENNIASIKTALKLGFIKTDKTYNEVFRNKEYLHYIFELSIK